MQYVPYRYFDWLKFHKTLRSGENEATMLQRNTQQTYLPCSAPVLHIVYVTINCPKITNRAAEGLATNLYCILEHSRWVPVRIINVSSSTKVIFFKMEFKILKQSTLQHVCHHWGQLIIYLYDKNNTEQWLWTNITRHNVGIDKPTRASRPKDVMCEYVQQLSIYRRNAMWPKVNWQNVQKCSSLKNNITPQNVMHECSSGKPKSFEGRGQIVSKNDIQGNGRTDYHSQGIKISRWWEKRQQSRTEQVSVCYRRKWERTARLYFKLHCVSGRRCSNIITLVVWYF